MNLCFWVVLDRPELGELLHAAVDAALPEPARVAPLSAQVAGPWLPAELLRQAPPLPPRVSLCWLETEDRRGRTLSPAAEAALARAPLGPVERGCPPRAEELVSPELSRRLGSCLLLSWSEGPSFAAAALWREGRCRWSLALGETLVRFDGEQRVEVRDPRRMVPNDRAELWRLGLEKLLHEPVQLDRDERLALPDLFAGAMV